MQAAKPCCWTLSLLFDCFFFFLCNWVTWVSGKGRSGTDLSTHAAGLCIESCPLGVALWLWFNLGFMKRFFARGWWLQNGLPRAVVTDSTWQSSRSTWKALSDIVFFLCVCGLVWIQGFYLMVHVGPFQLCTFYDCVIHWFCEWETWFWASQECFEKPCCEQNLGSVIVLPSGMSFRVIQSSSSTNAPTGIRWWTLYNRR